MSEQKVDQNLRKEKMTKTNITFLERIQINPVIIYGTHTHLNLLDGNKLLKGGLIK